MWSTFTSAGGQFRLPHPSKISKSTSQYTGLVYFSLDFGLIWNQNGGQYPTLCKWTWCIEDSKQVTDYIDGLWNQGLLPILHGEKICLDLADKILSYFKIPPPTFVGIAHELLHSCILNSWAKKKEYSHLSHVVNQMILPQIGISIKESPYVYLIGSTSQIGVQYPLEKIFSDPIKNIDLQKPHLLILVGQDGSGKTTICKRLGSEYGWDVVSNIEAHKIRYASTRSTSRVIDRFKNMLLNIGRGKSPGIVIDSSNPLASHRDIFIKLALECKVDFKVGWITRPGWVYNTSRGIRSPEICLHTYAKQLEPPSEEENAFRLI